MRRSKRGQQQSNTKLHLALTTGRDQPGFVVRYIDQTIGYGVYTTKNFYSGDFLLEYKGELMSEKEGSLREQEYSEKEGSFLFFFCHGGQKLCLDASLDPFDTNKARMVNDSHCKPNSAMRVIPFGGRPRLCLFAIKSIPAGVELRYDYGVADLPWRMHPEKKKLKRSVDAHTETICDKAGEVTENVKTHGCEKHSLGVALTQITSSDGCVGETSGRATVSLDMPTCDRTTGSGVGLTLSQHLDSCLTGKDGEVTEDGKTNGYEEQTADVAVTQITSSDRCIEETSGRATVSLDMPTCDRTTGSGVGLTLNQHLDSCLTGKDGEVTEDGKTNGYEEQTADVAVTQITSSDRCIEETSGRATVSLDMPTCDRTTGSGVGLTLSQHLDSCLTGKDEEVTEDGKTNGYEEQTADVAVTQITSSDRCIEETSGRASVSLNMPTCDRATGSGVGLTLNQHLDSCLTGKDEEVTEDGKTNGYEQETADVAVTQITSSDRCIEETSGRASVSLNMPTCDRATGNGVGLTLNQHLDSCLTGKDGEVTEDGKTNGYEQETADVAVTQITSSDRCIEETSGRATVSLNMPTCDRATGSGVGLTLNQHLDSCLTGKDGEVTEDVKTNGYEQENADVAVTQITSSDRCIEETSGRATVSLGMPVCDWTTGSGVGLTLNQHLDSCLTGKDGEVTEDVKTNGYEQENADVAVTQITSSDRCIEETSERASVSLNMPTCDRATGSGVGLTLNQHLDSCLTGKDEEVTEDGKTNGYEQETADVAVTQITSSDRCIEETSGRASVSLNMPTCDRATGNGVGLTLNQHLDSCLTGKDEEVTEDGKTNGYEEQTADVAVTQITSSDRCIEETSGRATVSLDMPTCDRTTGSGVGLTLSQHLDSCLTGKDEEVTEDGKTNGYEEQTADVAVTQITSSDRCIEETSGRASVSLNMPTCDRATGNGVGLTLNQHLDSCLTGKDGEVTEDGKTNGYEQETADVAVTQITSSDRCIEETSGRATVSLDMPTCDWTTGSGVGLTLNQHLDSCLTGKDGEVTEDGKTNGYEQETADVAVTQITSSDRCIEEKSLEETDDVKTPGYEKHSGGVAPKQITSSDRCIEETSGRATISLDMPACDWSAGSGVGLMLNEHSDSCLAGKDGEVTEDVKTNGYEQETADVAVTQITSSDRCIEENTGRATISLGMPVCDWTTGSGVDLMLNQHLDSCLTVKAREDVRTPGCGKHTEGVAVKQITSSDGYIEEASACSSASHDSDDSDFVPDSVDECSSDGSEVFPMLSPVLAGVRAADKPHQATTPDSTTGIYEPKVNVPGVKKGQKRVYDKYQACYFCHKLVKKIARHLEVCHKEELQVAQAFASKGKERKRLIKQLRLKGNFKHNIAVLAKGKGHLIVVRRKKNCSPDSDYLPCKFCLGFYSKKELWKHVGCCDSRTFDCEETDIDAVKSGKWLLLGSVCPRYEQDDLVKFVLCTLRDDAISEAIKKDSFILQLGNCKLQKLGTNKAHVVREELRLAARILLELRRMTDKPMAFISDFLNPGYFDVLTSAVRNICIQAEKRSLTGAIQFEKPAVALKMGQVLKKLICLKEGWAIRNKNIDAKEEAGDLLKLYHREWCDRVNALAFQTLRERKYNSTELLPFTEDLQKLKGYQVQLMHSLTKMMMVKPTGDLWRKLALTTLGRISIFNKRREAEIGEVPLAVYLHSRQSTSANGDLMEGLTDFEKNLCSRLHHFEIIGKQNRKVPVVLTKDMVDALDTLVSQRRFAKTLPDNPFLFASGGRSHLKTAEAIKLATREAGLVHPELITSTKLRKYMATVSQVVSLTENELDYLANHMGHNISVHRNFYRLQESTIELAKVSRLLIAAEEGKMGSFAGKSLDDITFNDLPEYCERHSVDQTEEQQHTESTFEQAASTSFGTKVTDDFLEDEEMRELLSYGKPKGQKGKSTKRTCWSSAEMDAIATLVEQSVVQRKPPTKVAVAACQDQNLILSHREWKPIKFRVWAQAQREMKIRQTVKDSLLS